MLDGADGEKNARAIFGDLIDLFVEIDDDDFIDI